MVQFLLLAHTCHPLPYSYLMCDLKCTFTTAVSSQIIAKVIWLFGIGTAGEGSFIVLHPFPLAARDNRANLLFPLPHFQIFRIHPRYLKRQFLILTSMLTVSSDSALFVYSSWPWSSLDRLPLYKREYIICHADKILCFWCLRDRIRKITG